MSDVQWTVMVRPVFSREFRPESRHTDRRDAVLAAQEWERGGASAYVDEDPLTQPRRSPT